MFTIRYHQTTGRCKIFWSLRGPIPKLLARSEYYQGDHFIGIFHAGRHGICYQHANWDTHTVPHTQIDGLSEQGWVKKHAMYRQMDIFHMSLEKRTTDTNSIAGEPVEYDTIIVICFWRHEVLLPRPIQICIHFYCQALPPRYIGPWRLCSLFRWYASESTKKKTKAFVQYCGSSCTCSVALQQPISPVPHPLCLFFILSIFACTPKILDRAHVWPCFSTLVRSISALSS